VRKWGAIFIAVLMAAPLWAQDPERALKTESAELIAVGKVRADFSVEFLHRARYSLSGLEGDLLRMGVMNFRVGVGEYAEFQISGVGRDYLTVTHRSQAILPATFTGDTTSDFGDLILATKLKLAPEKGIRPALSFRFAVQLPNASNENGLGNDETGFYSSLLLTKRLGSSEISGNLGLAILGSPVQSNSQADMLTYGLNVILPVHKRLELVGELIGRQGPVRVGNESLSRAQVGMRIRAAGMRWDITGMAGLKHDRPCTGFAIGMSFDFQAFHKKKSPVTIRTEKTPEGN
jgi:hypothetical protein